MTEWTTAVWGAVGSAFLVGLIVGVLIVRLTSQNVQKQLKLETDLKAAQDKVGEQKAQLEGHFAQSATLLASLAEDYKNLYTHLAKSSAQLLPEEKQTEFFKLPQPIANANPEHSDNQPRDYSEGSSGLFKQQ